MQRSSLFLIIGIVGLVAGVLFYTSRAPVESTPPSAAVAAIPELVQYPTFTLNDLDGNPRELVEWDGRHRLLNFWATWCAPCRREIPLLKEFQAEQADDGILVIGIAVDFAKEVAAYAEQAEFNYPILVGQEDAMAVAESTGLQFIAMPFTMFISRNGEFLSAYIGELHRSHLDEVSSILGRLDNGAITTEDAKAALELL
ncbi:MAG: TlpA family protein disulfide reductase [Proteobacteria bacterium]|nr:TlpA family protein disulfide reductase [Pseudomonadota bacterium]